MSYKKLILDFWREYRQIKTGVVGLILLIGVLSMGILAPYISPYSPYQLHDELNSPPSWAGGEGDHLLGTDYLGRDLLSQVIWGSRASLTLGVAVAGIALVIGIVVGLIPGWYGGKVDHLFSRVFELFLTLPRLLFAIVLATIFGASFEIIIFVLAITLWPSNAKLTRAQVFAWKNRTFVEAAVSMGASTPRILVSHILPNGISPLLANSFLQMARATLAEAALAFLGLSDPSVVSWGRTLLFGQRVPSAWWMLVFPGLCISLLILGLNFIGEAINIMLNPRLRER